MYSALSGNIAKMQALEIFTNNLTNANTFGYKRDRFAFEALLSSADQNQKSGGINYTRMQQSFVDFTPGINQRTGGNLDFAINDEGFFKVENEDGEEFLTRLGKFHLAQDGTLVNSHNMKVLNVEGKPVVIPPDAQNIEVNDKGNVYADGTEAGQIGLFNVDDLSKLKKTGGGVFVIAPWIRVDPVATPNIQQGALESSNVNIIGEMAQLMDGLRAFEAYQKVMKTYSDIGAKADELGSVG